MELHQQHSTFSTAVVVMPLSPPGEEGDMVHVIDEVETIESSTTSDSIRMKANRTMCNHTDDSYYHRNSRSTETSISNFETKTSEKMEEQDNGTNIKASNHRGVTPSPPVSMDMESYFGAFCKEENHCETAIDAGSNTIDNVANNNTDKLSESDIAIMGDQELANVVKVNHHTKDTISSLESDYSKISGVNIDRTNGRDKWNRTVVSIVPPLHAESIDAPGGFDVCKEYGFKYEYTVDDEDDDDDDGDDVEGGEGDHSIGDAAANKIENQQPISKCNSPTNAPSFSASSTSPATAITSSSSIRYQSTLNLTQNTRTTNQNNFQYISQNHVNRYRNDNYTTYILGKQYHPVLDYAPKRDDESSLLWFTYRTDFPPIQPYNISTDAGWGCMLRAAQMLLAQAMRLHYHDGRRELWTPPKSMVKRRGDGFMQDIMMWFADFPCGDCGCWYGLHNLVAAGMARYETLPGEWFGPGTACQILRDACSMHSKAWEKKFGCGDGEHIRNGGDNNHGYRRSQTAMRIHVAQEGCVYKDSIEELMTKDSALNGEKIQSTAGLGCMSSSNKNENGNSNKNKDLLLIENDEMLHPLSQMKNESDTMYDLDWDTGLLLLVPLRLGLKTFNASSYRIPLAHTFSFPQSVGFMGGSPRHALWFYGANSDGSKLYGLDPHTVQNAPRRRRLKPEEIQRTGNTKIYQVQLTDEYLRSVNCSNPTCMDMSKIDPSLSLGFYCKDRADFHALCASIEDMKEQGKKQDIPELFSIADAAPNYAADVSSAMEMMMNCSSQIGGDDDDFAGDGGEDAMSDDDDYVML